MYERNRHVNRKKGQEFKDVVFRVAVPSADLKMELLHSFEFTCYDKNTGMNCESSSMRTKRPQGMTNVMRLCDI